MILSIIIVNWNTCEITLNCLKSIYRFAPEVNFEVIVVDNASDDDSVEKLSKKYPQAKLVQNEKNLGFASANNIGFYHAKGDYILFLNSDTIILDNVLTESLYAYKKLDGCGFLGCRVLNKDRTLQPTCFMFPSILNIILSILYFNKLFKRNVFFGREQMTWWKRDTLQKVETVTGCYMLTSRIILDEIGLMDDGFFMYGEETDLCMRSMKKGYTNYFVPSGEIIHLGGASTNKVKPKMILQLRSGILQFINKHHRQPYYILACFLTSLWFFFRIPYWGVMFLKNPKDDSKEIFLSYIKGFLRAIRGYKALSMI